MPLIFFLLPPLALVMQHAAWLWTYASYGTRPTMSVHGASNGFESMLYAMFVPALLMAIGGVFLSPLMLVFACLAWLDRDHIRTPEARRAVLFYLLGGITWGVLTYSVFFDSLGVTEWWLD